MLGRWKKNIRANILFFLVFEYFKGLSFLIPCINECNAACCKFTMEGTRLSISGLVDCCILLILWSLKIFNAQRFQQLPWLTHVYNDSTANAASPETLICLYISLLSDVGKHSSINQTKAMQLIGHTKQVINLVNQLRFSSFTHEHVHIKEVGFATYDQSQTWTEWSWIKREIRTLKTVRSNPPS